MKKLNIGLYGYGVVGQGLYTVLQKSKTVDAKVSAICVKHDKKRDVDENLITKDRSLILNNDDINVVVELIDDAGEAYQIVKEALLKGKSVVSGNKAMLAEHLEELIKIQEETGSSLLYDASSCGSIPVIRNLEEYYDNDLLVSLTGILNGSSNYILTQIFRDGKDYETALKEAQELGFAESDPSFDVSGKDSLFKLVILTLHAFGILVHTNKVFRFGIENLNDFDVKYTKEKGFNLKLVAKVVKVGDNKIAMYVMPTMLTRDKYIYGVEDEYNGVVIKGQFYDKQFMFGKGAGAYPTGSAVLSDITALAHNYKYEYKKRKFFKSNEFTGDYSLKIYLRFDNKKDSDLFEFEEIYEQYSGKGTNYVIGKISLKNLLKINDKIEKLPVFVSVIP